MKIKNEDINRLGNGNGKEPVLHEQLKGSHKRNIIMITQDFEEFKCKQNPLEAITTVTQNFDDFRCEHNHLKVYVFDDGKPFAFIWYSQENILPYFKKKLETFNETPIVKELTHVEAKEWHWSFDKGNTLLNGCEALEYLEKNNIKLKEPLLS